MIEFVERNGYEIEQPDVDEAVQVMVDLAAGSLPEAGFVDWLRPRIRRAESSDED